LKWYSRAIHTHAPATNNPYLGADHARALVDAAQGLAQVLGAVHKGNRELALVDVVVFVGRRKNLALVNVVDAQRLEDL
jgi:hypothetical protein